MGNSGQIPGYKGRPQRGANGRGVKEGRKRGEFRKTVQNGRGAGEAESRDREGVGGGGGRKESTVAPRKSRNRQKPR